MVTVLVVVMEMVTMMRVVVIDVHDYGDSDGYSQIRGAVAA